MSKHKETSKGSIKFTPSIQSALFNYLKPEQQEFIRPILRVLKKTAQEDLCTSLLDYMETGKVIITDNVVLGGMFTYLTRHHMPELDSIQDKRIIRPLQHRGKAPQKIGEIINRIFPSFKGQVPHPNL